MHEAIDQVNANTDRIIEVTDEIGAVIDETARRSAQGMLDALRPQLDYTRAVRELAAGDLSDVALGRSVRALPQPPPEWVK